MFKQLLIATFIWGSAVSLVGQVISKPLSIKDTITDKDIQVPEEIERNFDQLLVDWRKDLKPSSVCPSNFDTDIFYPDSVYINRLYAMPTIMEMAYNPVVRSYIDMYTGRRRSSVEYFLGKSSYFFPIFEEALDKYGLPLELKYLPIIESALNPTIVSRAGATGLWQFMIGTGKMYNLEINSLVDERRDPFRSTDAAARYLKDLYNIYGDWNLVIAAYNCGPGNVNKAIKRSGGETDYWAIYPYLPRETRGYVPAFIAAAYIMNYYSAHNICPFEYKYTHSTDTIEIDKYLHLQQLADVLNVPIEQVRDLNPQFKKDIVPGEFKKYLVTLPSAPATDFEVYKDSVYSYRSADLLAHRKVVEPKGSMLKSGSSKIRYKVRRGESLSSIASKQGVTVQQIRSWNKLKSNKLRTGQILAIHKSVSKPKVVNENTNNNQYLAENISNPSPSVPTTSDDNSIKQEQTSNILAEYFSKYSQQENKTMTDASPVAETSPASIKNKLEVDNENGVDEQTRTPNEIQTIYHKVRIGETLALIATKYNVDKKDISSWNKLKSSVPKIGQRLIIHLASKPEKQQAVLFDETEGEHLTDQNLIASNEKDKSIGFENYRQVAAIISTSPIITDTHNRTENKETHPSTQPTKKNEKKKAPKQAVYTVKKGDTLSHIVGKFGGKITARDIMKANRLTSDKLKIGQKLKIPR